LPIRVILRLCEQHVVQVAKLDFRLAESIDLQRRAEQL
jgi:hypothetical protein